MDLPDWHVGKSGAYVECVDKFVEQFGEDADLEKDLEAESDDPEGEDLELRETKRQVVAEFIQRAFPDDAHSFQDDALAALIFQREIFAEDDRIQYGHLDEYGESRIRPNEDN